ncbi:uncharacterized protein ARMOST_12192 [Armillaria ostoyae]|uniref:Uncharacterized protein n=1 Tax=Armillaria ostoyae TaxID=47428 RepID=A0A284RJ75_ARMOS|nr:uncharacterized protein ARMOST_12192 [Armillaria ostoyae]
MFMYAITNSKINREPERVKKHRNQINIRAKRIRVLGERDIAMDFSLDGNLDLQLVEVQAELHSLLVFARPRVQCRRRPISKSAALVVVTAPHNSPSMYAENRDDWPSILPANLNRRQSFMTDAEQVRRRGAMTVTGKGAWWLCDIDVPPTPTTLHQLLLGF